MIKRTCEWQINNRDQYNRNSRNFKKRHPGRGNANTVRRNAKKFSAIPRWADLDKIRAVYESCPEGHHVDHIIPLNSPIVCGLHCEDNLQILTATENLKKGNRLLIELMDLA